MSDAKPNYLPWIIAGVLVLYIVRNPQRQDDTTPRPQPSQTITQVLNEAYKADRAGRIEMLKDLGQREFASDQAKLDWLNSESERRRLEVYRAWNDRLAEAIYGGTVQELVRALEAGR